MRAAKRKRERSIRIVYGPLETARGALKFGREGGCSAGCENCLYLLLCEGGEIGEEQEESDTQDKETWK